MLAVYSHHRLVVHNSELLSCLLAAADTEQSHQRKVHKSAGSASASSKGMSLVQSLTASNTPEDMQENGLAIMALCVSVCMRDGFQFQPSLYCFAEFVEF